MLCAKMTQKVSNKREQYSTGETKYNRMLGILMPKYITGFFTIISRLRTSKW